MKAEKKIRISQCMIVKNEEKNIEKALSWGREIMWEQIVVDTGSTDRTVEIAERMGAKVFHFSWIDDFSAAKNAAIGRAQGDWIAFLDADEYMMPEDAAKLPALLGRLQAQGFDGLQTGLQLVDETGRILSSGTHVRFFRNDPDIRYRRRIHEQLSRMSGRNLRLGDASGELSVFHVGYQAEAAEKKKGRNRRLILAELEEHPQDPELLGYMGDDCFGDGETEEAERWYRRAVEQMPDRLAEYDQRSAYTFTNLLKILTGKEGAQWEDAEEVYRLAVRLLPGEADFDYVAGCFFAEKEDAQSAVQYLETALGKLETYGCSNRAFLLAGNLLEAYELLSVCCRETGELQKCVNYAVACLKYDRYRMRALDCLLGTLLPGGSGPEGTAEQEAVLGFLQKLYEVKDLKDRLFLLKTAERSGRGGFAGFLRSRLFTEEELGRFGLQRDFVREGAGDRK